MVDNQIIYTWEYRGTSIALDERGAFKIDDSEDLRHFPSLHLAKVAVDDRVAVEAKARHTDLAMPVIDEHGNRQIIRGLNRGSGKVLGIPDGVGTLYYPTPAIEAMAKEHADLERRSVVLRAKLRRVTMPDHIGSGRIRAEDYDARIATLKEKYNAAMVAAEDLDDAPTVVGLAEGQ